MSESNMSESNMSESNMSEPKILHPKLALTLLEEGIDPASVLIAGQIDCPQYLGRQGAFVRDSRGVIVNHIHGLYFKCEHRADVYSIGSDPEGRKRYRAVCWKQDETGQTHPEHVHDLDERAFAALKTEVDILRYRG